MNKKILLLCICLIAASAEKVSITKVLIDSKNFDDHQNKFFKSSGSLINKIQLDKALAIGTFTSNDILKYTSPLRVPARQSITGSFVVFTSQTLTSSDVLVVLGTNNLNTVVATEVTVQYDPVTKGQQVRFSTKDYKDAKLELKFKVKASSWSFSQLQIEAEYCGPYCSACSGANPDFCTACPANSVLNTETQSCECKTGYKATAIFPLTCQAESNDAMFPDVCYLEHVQFLALSNIKSCINKEDEEFVITSTFSSRVFSNKCWEQNNKQLMLIQTCFTLDDFNAPESKKCGQYGIWTGIQEVQIRIHETELANYSFLFDQGISTTVMTKDKVLQNAFEYNFQVDYAFKSDMKDKWACSGDCDVAIRTHEMSLKVIYNIDLKIAPLQFVTENVHTKEECNCAYSVDITGKAYWFDDQNCLEGQSENRAVFNLLEDMNLAVILNTQVMVGNINIKSLIGRCEDKAKRNSIGLFYTILGTDNTQSKNKVCVNSRAIVPNQSVNYTCEDCYFSLAIDLEYTREQINTIGNTEGFFIPKLTQNLQMKEKNLVTLGTNGNFSLKTEEQQ